jgi:nucleoporin SEH1
MRIYEASEVNNLSKWALKEEISTLPPRAPPQYSGDSSFTFAWCPSRIGGQQLVVAANNFVYLYRPDERGQWQVAELVQDDGGLIRCVTWAPGGQRGFELIATGSKAGLVRIYKLLESSEGMIVGGGGYAVEMLGQFEHHGETFNQVQSLSWNVTGTMLSSSGDDGRIRIWKEDHLGKWRQHFILSTERYGLARFN